MDCEYCPWLHSHVVGFFSVYSSVFPVQYPRQVYSNIFCIFCISCPLCFTNIFFCIDCYVLIYKKGMYQIIFLSQFSYSRKKWHFGFGILEFLKTNFLLTIVDENAIPFSVSICSLRVPCFGAGATFFVKRLYLIMVWKTQMPMASWNFPG